MLFCTIESSPCLEFMTALMQLTHSSCRNASTNAILPPRLNLSKAWKSTSMPPSLRNSAIHSGELVWSFVLSPEKFRRHEELSSRTQSSAETSVEIEKFSICFPTVVQLNCWRTAVHLFATLTLAITDNGVGTASNEVGATNQNISTTHLRLAKKPFQSH